MVYTNTNGEKFSWVRALVLLPLLFTAATKTYIFRADLLVNEETGQKIICLSDFHYYPAHWRDDPEKKILPENNKKLLYNLQKMRCDHLGRTIPR